MTITPEMLTAIENDIKTAKAEKTRISMRDAIAQLAPLMRTKLAEGLTLHEIHAVFSRHLPDATVSESTFRKYFREAGGKAAGGGDKRRPPAKARPARLSESGGEKPVKDDATTDTARGFRTDREDI